MSTPRQYDVTAEIDARPLGRYQILLFLLCGFIIGLDGFDIQVVSFTAPLLANHIDIPVTSLGPVFSAGLTGLMIGSFVISPFGDRFGRKRLIQIACVIFGVFTIATAYADTLTTLMVIRFLAGLGLGGCIPNALALAAEFAPRHVKTKVVTIVVSATPLGAALGGVACGLLTPGGQWRTVYWIGGLLPLVGGIALTWLLPESIRFMVAANESADKVLAVLRRLAPDLSVQPDVRFVRHEEISRGVPVQHLFSNGYAERTLLLWVPYLMVFLISFLLSSWLPAVLKGAGVPLSQAMLVLVVFNLGGFIGAVVLGKFIEWLGVYPTLTAAYLLCALSVMALGQVATQYWGALTVIVVIGVCIQGTICCLYALASSVYPIKLRATGIGWASGAGRLGAIFGPLWGGAMLQFGWDMKLIFGSAAIPALISILALLRLSTVSRRVGMEEDGDAGRQTLRA